MLEVRDLHAFYGKSHILHGVHLDMREGEIVSILLVEQKLAIALDISERLYVMGHGRIVFEGTPAELRGNAYIRKEWLEV